MSRVTLINPPGIKTFSSIQMQTPNPPIGLAYIAGVLRKESVTYSVIDAVGDAMDTISTCDGNKEKATRSEPASLRPVAKSS